MAKSAGSVAAIWVLLSVLGLAILIGVILVMMWFGPGIQHSPSETGTLSNGGTPRAISAAASAAQNWIVKDLF